MVLCDIPYRAAWVQCLGIWLLSAMAADAGVLVWGLDDVGQLGLRRPIHQAKPVTVNESGALAGRRIQQVVGGMNHTLALSDSGEVYAWGRNNLGQLGTGALRPETEPVAVPMAAFGGKTVVGLAAGNNFSLAWTLDGKVFAWGSSEYGQCGRFTKTVLTPTLVPADERVKKVVAGDSFVLALTDLGKVLSWGRNTFGQLGDGSQSHSATPNGITVLPPASTAVITDISAGHHHSLALADDGRIHSWGLNMDGQLGRTTVPTFSVLPAMVDMTGALAGKKVLKLTAGSAHSLVLADDGRLYAWGDNRDSTYLGVYQFTGTSSTLPLAVRMHEFGSRRIIQITAGYYHSMALTDDGLLFSWGFNGGRQLGGGDFQPSLVVPCEMPRTGSLVGKTISQLAVQVIGGSVHALTTDGALVGWGWNHSGQVGNGANAWRTAPVDLMPATHTAAGAKVAVSPDQTLMINGYASDPAQSFPAENLYGWGNFSAINLVSNFQPRPTAFGILEGPSDWRCVAGIKHCLFLDGNGVLYSFGDNAYGQLGIGTTLPSNTLVPVFSTGVLSGKGFAQIMTGGNHSMVLTTDGGLYAWGRNDFGQLGTGNTQQTLVPTAAGLSDAFAGQVPAFIAAGDDHSLAVTQEGRVYAWGLNDRGQLGDGSRTNRLSPVEIPLTGSLAGKTISKAWAGSTHSLVQATDGTLFGWGSNDYGQLGAGTTSTEELVAVPVVMDGALAGKTVAKITAGMNFTLILCNDGTVCGMGDNRFGSLGTGDRVDHDEPTAITSTAALAGRMITDLGAAKSGYSVAAITHATGPELHLTSTASPTLYSNFGDGFFDGRLTAGTLTRPAGIFNLNFGNKSSVPIRVSSFQISGPDASSFRLSPLAGPEMTIQPGETRWLTVQAIGTSSQTRVGTFRCTTEDPAYGSLDIPLEMRSREASSGVGVWLPKSTETINHGEALLVQAQSSNMIESYEWTKSGSSTVISNRPFLQIDPATMDDAGVYRVKVYGISINAINETAQSWITINIRPTPRISRQPESLTVGPGGVAEFTVEGDSPEGPLRYQWFHGGVAISGATSATLRLQPVIPDMAGEYEVRLTNPTGTARSRKIKLTVPLGAPVVVSSLSDIAFAGESMSLKSHVYGLPPFQIQWYKSDKLIPKATGWTYSPSPKMSAALMGSYSFTVAGASTTPQPSAPGWLGMMTRAPASAYVVAGKSIDLLCTASSPPGTTLEYEWKRDGQPLNGVAYLYGQLTKRLKIVSAEAHHSGSYTCEVSMITPRGKITRSHGNTTLTVFEVPSVTPDSVMLPRVRVGQLVTHALVGVKNPISFRATGLPPGISIHKTSGLLSGRPTVARWVNGVNVPYKVRITVTNPAGSTTTQELDWLVLPLQAVGQYHGLVDRSAALNGSPGMSAGLGGNIQLTLSSLGSSTGSLTLGAVRHLLKGDWNLDSADDATLECTFTILRKRPLPDLTFIASIETTTGRLSGDLSNGVSPVPVIGSRMVPDSHRQGYYNTVLQPTGTLPERPGGAGIVSLRLSARGQAQWTGRLADGSSVTYGSGVGSAGDVPLHLLLYVGKGSIQGWTQIALDGSSNGSLSWVKATNGGGTSYPAGFDLHPLYSIGEKYARAAAGSNLLGYREVEANALLRLSYGSLATPITQVFTMTPQQTAVVPPNHSLKLSLAPATGWFSGSFTSADKPGRSGTIQGLLLPKLKLGLGYFLQAPPSAQTPAAPVRSGLVEIIPND